MQEAEQALEARRSELEIAEDTKKKLFVQLAEEEGHTSERTQGSIVETEDAQEANLKGSMIDMLRLPPDDLVSKAIEQKGIESGEKDSRTLYAEAVQWVLTTLAKASAVPGKGPGGQSARREGERPEKRTRSSSKDRRSRSRGSRDGGAGETRGRP
eukprot:5814741-Alexandrium_andersonii.AAC.1